MKVLIQRSQEANAGEIRIQYRLDGYEEHTVTDAVNIALSGIEASGIKREPFTAADLHRFDELQELPEQEGEQ